MNLARAAADRAMQDLTDPQPIPAPEEGELAFKPTDHALLFTRLSRAVRESITLEARLAAGHAATAPDPRRARIRNAIRQATERHLNRAEIREEADERLETELALDPDGTASLPDLLSTICEDLGFQIDYEKLAAELRHPAPH